MISDGRIRIHRTNSVVRQGDYALRFRIEGPYTPQMVVDGDMELVGSDERRAIQVIKNTIKTAKLPVVLSSIHREDDKERLLCTLKLVRQTPREDVRASASLDRFS